MHVRPQRKHRGNGIVDGVGIKRSTLQRIVCREKNAHVFSQKADKVYRTRQQTRKEADMIVKAKFAAVNHGTYSEYEVSENGTEGFGIMTDDGYMVFDNEADATEYARLIG